MKRLLIGLLSAIGFALPLSADNVISVSSPGGQPGDEVELTLSMQNTDDVVAAEIRIPLDQYVKYVDGSATLNAERSDGHQISASGADNELRVYVYSIGNKPIKGNSGVLATVRLKLGNKAEKLTLTPTTVLSNAGGQSLAVSAQTGQVTILAPHLTVTTSQINYGHIPIRSTYTRTLTLKNTGTKTLNVSDITFSASELSATDRSFSIEPNASHNVTVTYAPVKHGAINATATITSDAINEENTAAIVADPYSVNELHIGNADGNSDTEVTVDVTMNNMEPIVAAQWSFTLPDALKYVEGSAISGTHAEGLSATAMVSGKKLTVFLYSQNNTPIPEGDGSIASFKVSLQGQSGTYYLTPSDITLSNIAMENMVSASTRGTVKIKSPKISTNSSLIMPESPVTETVTQTFAIRNSGQTAMTVSKVTFLNEGFSIVEEMPITIGANATKNITVQYQPTKAGNYSTTMQIYTNDPETRMKSVAVSGVIYEPNTVSIDGAWAEDRSAYIANIAVENYTELVAAQMDIHLPVGASINDVANALTNTDRLAGLSSTIAKIDDSTYRIVVFSFNNTHIKGNSGNILSLKIDVGDVYSMANKQILIDNIKLSSANGKDFSSANEATTILPDVAAAEATAFKTAHAEILGKTVDTVVSSDLPAIASALNDYGQLADAVKAKLVPEKNLLDALKAKAEEIKAAEEADAAATAEANTFKITHATILAKTVDTVASSDLPAITTALTAYEELSDAAKAKLVDGEKSLLDALKAKAEEIKAAEEADAAATAEANTFKTAHATILAKTVDTVASSDLPAITTALTAYDELSDAAKAKLVDGEKSLLYALKAKAEEIKAAEEADAAATAEANTFKTTHATILAKTVDTVASSDLPAITTALTAYEELSDAAKAKLVDGEKSLLDALKAKAEEIKAAEEADAAATAEANTFKTAHATILGKTTETITSSDLPAITAALTAYEELSDAAKAKLVDGEKSLLDALKAKAEEIKAAEEADAAATAEANTFKTTHATILGKTTETVRSSDLPAITAALTAYEELSDAAKAKLVDGEKSLLDALKAKAEEIKAAEEADAAATAEANTFKTTHATILGKTTETVTSSDLPAITAALAAYEELSDAAKAKLVDGEKSLLDALKAKAEEPQYIMGDVNGDGKITAQDLTMLTNRILGTTSPAFVEAAADINGDGKITAQDLPLLTNLILK